VVKFSTGESKVRKHYDTLWERNRLALAKTDTGEASGLRFSAHIYNTRDEIDRAVRAIKEVLA
jgi:selenocysteine lyase/cysteine desulfurase